MIKQYTRSDLEQRMAYNRAFDHVSDATKAVIENALLSWMNLILEERGHDYSQRVWEVVAQRLERGTLGDKPWPFINSVKKRALKFAVSQKPLDEKPGKVRASLDELAGRMTHHG